MNIFEIGASPIAPDGRELNNIIEALWHYINFSNVRAWGQEACFYGDLAKVTGDMAKELSPLKYNTNQLNRFMRKYIFDSMPCHTVAVAAV